MLKLYCEYRDYTEKIERNLCYKERGRTLTLSIRRISSSSNDSCAADVR